MQEKYESSNMCPCCDKSSEECDCEQGCKDCDCKKSVKESFTFDKFMDSIVLQENKRRPVGDSPNRERAKRHQEFPLNRIRFGGR